MADLELLKGFIVESLDLLDDVEPKLIELQSAGELTGTADSDLINTIFRAFHSVKGGAGMLELNSVMSLTHTAETLMDKLRAGQMQLLPVHVDLLLASVDLVRQMLAQCNESGEDAGFEQNVNSLVAELDKAILGEATSQTICSDSTSKERERPLAKQDLSIEPAALDIEIPISADMLNRFVQEGADLIDQLEEALLEIDKSGDSESVSLAFRAIHSLKGNSGFMGLADLESLAHKMENVLQAMKDGGIRSFAEPVAVLLKWIDVLRNTLADVSQGNGGKIQNCSVYIDFLTDMLAEWIKKPKEVPGAALAGEEKEAITTAEPIHPENAAPKVSADAPTPKVSIPTVAQAKTIIRQDIRVDLGKLDNLINLVGELVIAEAMMTRNPVIASHEDESVERAVHQLRRVSRELQDVAMSVRMIPLAGTFQRMIRLVHDLAGKSGKKVNLQLLGEETEVDKTVIEQIGDPIVHIVRNSLDHGIEPPEERVKLGKQETATVTIEGRHESGEVWISISDDGRGLNRERIVQKAIERGLVRTDGSDLTDEQVYKLIFEPGFSTADKITDISGRGVGMDVVKKNIEKIKGRVDVRSVPGKGATIILRIPLTLAIIDGMLVRVGDSRYIIPILAIRESVHPEAQQVTSTPDGTELIRVRDEFYPVIRIHRLFNKKPQYQELHEGIVVLVEIEGQRIALFIDEILGQQEAVIKGLSSYVAKARGISGCTILGDGEVSLILDVAALAACNSAPGMVM